MREPVVSYTIFYSDARFRRYRDERIMGNILRKYLHKMRLSEREPGGEIYFYADNRKLIIFHRYVDGSYWKMAIAILTYKAALVILFEMLRLRNYVRRLSDVSKRVATKMKGGGGTKIRNALSYVYRRVSKTDAVIVLTDGYIHDSPNSDNEGSFRYIICRS